MKYSLRSLMIAVLVLPPLLAVAVWIGSVANDLILLDRNLLRYTFDPPTSLAPAPSPPKDYRD